jgi:Xaa-Pro aminopeptidase
MKRDLDDLMATRNLDAILIQGKVLGNPSLMYVLNGVHMTQALVIKKRGDEPRLIVGPMERDSAAGVGYPVILTPRYNYSGHLARFEGDVVAATVAYLQDIFEDLGVAGRVGFYGYLDQGYAYTLLKALDTALPDIEVVGEASGNLIQTARATKDAAEVGRIREVGRRTTAVVKATLAFLQAHAVGEDETLRKADGRALTVGDVHHHINDTMAAQGLEDPEGFIFAMGREAGIPHSRGRAAAPVRLGVPIVFDIFPREIGGGYFFDLTRTFCLGYAPEAMARLHADVVACLTMLKDEVRVGMETRRYQQMACAFFRERGYVTIQDDPATQEGYVHGIGHGVGLDIHEAPRFYDNDGNQTRLEPGHVFALEPGLYYPALEQGCRVEDVMWIDESGEVHCLTEIPHVYDLVVPVG